MKYLFFTIFLLTLLSCRHKPTLPDSSVQKPDTLIPREKMIRIITDVHLAEASIAYLKNKGSRDKYLNEDYLNAVFTKYKISGKTFTSNFNYYKQDQADLLKMYEKVVKNLEEMKTMGKAGKKGP